MLKCHRIVTVVHYYKKGNEAGGKMNNDKASKILFDDPEIVCGLLNGFLFDGNRLIKPENLSVQDPVVHFQPYFLKKVNRRVKELLADKVYFVQSEELDLTFYLVIQNQTYIDY